MKDGYYYFIPASAGKTDADKSLGYVSVTRHPKRRSYSIQCSLDRNAIGQSGNNNQTEIFLSSDTFINAQSIMIGKMSPSPAARIFTDVSLPASAVDTIEPEQYLIVTSSGRTLCYSVLCKQEPSAKPQQPPEPPPAPLHQGKAFDPFGTTNPAYQWFLYDSRDDAKTMQELDKILKYFKVQYEHFAKLNSGTPAAPYRDTFLKMAYHSAQIAGHILRGTYTDPTSERHFTIIGLAGWNMQNTVSAIRNRRTSRTRSTRQSAAGGSKTIREYARWLAAKQKPSYGYQGNYNGYWLYYFDAETGLPVKAVMKE